MLSIWTDRKLSCLVKSCTFVQFERINMPQDHSKYYPMIHLVIETESRISQPPPPHPSQCMSQLFIFPL